MSDNKFIERLKGKDTRKSILEINNEAAKTSFANMPSGTSNAIDVYSDHRADATAVLNGTTNWKISNNNLILANDVAGDGTDFSSTYSVSGAGLWIDSVYTFPSTGDPAHPVAMVFNPSTKWVLKVCGDNLIVDGGYIADFTLLVKIGTSNVFTKTFSVAEQAGPFCKEFILDFNETNAGIIKASGLTTLTVQLLCGTANASARIYNGMTILTALQRRIDASAVSASFANVEEVLRDGLLPNDYFSNAEFIDEIEDGEQAYALFERDGDNVNLAGWTSKDDIATTTQLNDEITARENADLGLQNQINTNKDTMDGHIANTSNPHQVTKAQVGLGNVDNTSDLDKPISTATQSALDLKMPMSTKYGASISLTIDSSTYVVTAQLKDQDNNNLGTAQTIDLPLESVVVSGSYDSDTKEVILVLENGSEIRFSVADLISGLQSEITAQNPLNADLVNDSTSAHKFVTATEKTNWNNHIANTNNPHEVTKTQVGLGNVDNTSDLNKPISTATQSALDSKVDKNAAISGATHTKITYDSKGLVTDGADITLSDVTDVTASAAEVNVLDGITATTTELNYVDGVTSNIQTQLNAKAVDTDVVHKTGNETISGTKTFNETLQLKSNLSFRSYGSSDSGRLQFRAQPSDNVIRGTVAITDGYSTAGSGYNGFVAQMVARAGSTTSDPFNTIRVSNKGVEYIQEANDGTITGQYIIVDNYGLIPSARLAASGSVGQVLTKTTTGQDWETLATVATSGSYNDLIDKPTIGNATLTIQKNSTTIDTFTANATSNKTIDIAVPTKTSDLNNDSGFITKSVNDLTNYTLSANLASVATTGTLASLTDTTISSLQGGQVLMYDADTGKWKNTTSTSSISWGGITGTLSDQSDLNTALSGKQATITGAATTITTNNLSAARALVSDSTGKVAVSTVTSTELGYMHGVTSNVQTQLGNKQATLVSGTNIKTINGTTLLGSGDITISSAPDIDNSTITKNGSDQLQAVAVIDQNTGIAKTWTGTMAEYEAIVTKDPETEYIITDDIGGSATEIGQITEALNDKVDKGHQVVEFQEPTSANNYTWYRKYADGWVEQGGKYLNQAASGSNTVNLLVTMADTNYCLITQRIKPATSAETGNEITPRLYNVTTTSFGADLRVSNGNTSTTVSDWCWQVSGIAA